MNLLRNLAFSRKFAIVGVTLLLVSSALIGSVFVALTDLASSSDRGWQRVTASAHVNEAGQLRDAIAVSVTEALSRVAETRDATTDVDPQQHLQDLAKQLQTSLRKAENALAGSDQERFAAVRANLEPILDSYLQTCEELLTLLANGQGDTALTDQRRLTNSFIQLGDQMAHLDEVLINEAAVLQAQTRHNVASTQWLLVGGAVVGMAFILLVLFLITRSITVPMAKLTQAATRIAAGDINQRVDYVSGDEIGTLAAAFRNVIRYIQEMAQAADTLSKGDLTVEITTRSEHDVLAHSFRRMVDNLRTINGKVKEGAHVVATSINQILASAAALTASVSETATSVSQTATTVEEVKQTAYVASQKANDISAGAQQTAEVSRSGEQAVAKAVAGMNRIREQMESISQSVVKLGEQSQVIGDIISAVGEVAEQSNLLAVNAAIEASKAGEQGKGFAVVAQEVKILAGQSKQATAQVRTILGEIQKSANVAVLVTEQGVKSVEVGVQQSLDAGESIRTLAKNITEAAHAVTQIAASSQQQLVGMDQVGVAMQSIKQASEQNANGMRQIQTAAQNLHQVGRTLKELVEQFKVTKNEHEQRPV
jgi:methyl-accepting chemotaxis protein